MKKKAPTVSGLKADLRAANAEAQSYLQRLRNMEEQLDRLREHNVTLQGALSQEKLRVDGLDHACAILFQALERAQQGK